MKNLLRKERVEKNLTQVELANKVNVSRQTIFAIESGKYVPSTILALKLAKMLNKKVEDVFILEAGD